MYDLIGDIHGHADELSQLLVKLEYRRPGGSYAHASRKAIFVGDFIDRGPKIRETLAIVRGMVESGAALAVMGNHELNALAFHTDSPDRPGEHLRSHSTKNIQQHQQTLDQLSARELANYLEWFRTLPQWLDLPELRVVHACWHEPAMHSISQSLQQHAGITSSFLREAFDESTQLFADVEVVLKGAEAQLPNGVSYFDKEGHERKKMRTRWYLPAEGHTYRSYGFRSEDIDCDLPISSQVVAAAQPYPPEAPPVFIGHYWLTGSRPTLLAPNVACLDYSVAKGGMLAAYRWDGEMKLDEKKFVTVWSEISYASTTPTTTGTSGGRA